jgi:hypothetical protein
VRQHGAPRGPVDGLDQGGEHLDRQVPFGGDRIVDADAERIGRQPSKERSDPAQPDELGVLDREPGVAQVDPVEALEVGLGLLPVLL